MSTEISLSILALPLILFKYLLELIPEFPVVDFEPIASDLQYFVDQSLGFNWIFPVSELGLWISIIGGALIADAFLKLVVYVVRLVRGV